MSDTFEYLAVLFSVVIGLAVAEILQGFRRLIALRRQIEVHWPAVIWCLVLLLVLAQTWWALFGLREQSDWTFTMYGAVLLQLVLLYLAAGLSIPEMDRVEPSLLKDSYHANARPFFLLVIASAVASLLKDVALSGSLPEWENVGFHVAFIALAVVAALTSREAVHRVVAISAGVLFSLYVGVLFSHSF